MRPHLLWMNDYINVILCWACCVQGDSRATSSRWDRTNHALVVRRRTLKQSRWVVMRFYNIHPSPAFASTSSEGYTIGHEFRRNRCNAVFCFWFSRRTNHHFQEAPEFQKGAPVLQKQRPETVENLVISYEVFVPKRCLIHSTFQQGRVPTSFKLEQCYDMTSTTGRASNRFYLSVNAAKYYWTALQRHTRGCVASRNWPDNFFADALERSIRRQGVEVMKPCRVSVAESSACEMYDCSASSSRYSCNARLNFATSMQYNTVSVQVSSGVQFSQCTIWYLQDCTKR